MSIPIKIVLAVTIVFIMIGVVYMSGFYDGVEQERMLFESFR